MRVEVAVTGQIGSSAQTAYRILSEYRQHHPQILPAGTFKGLTVEEGGQGEGTLILVELEAFGSKRTRRMRIDEPQPGRVLRETDLDDGTVTTFTVEPDSETRCSVTIETVWQPASGIGAIVDRAITPLFMRRLYRQELQNLDEYARRLEQAAP